MLFVAVRLQMSPRLVENTDSCVLEDFSTGATPSVKAQAVTSVE